MPGTYLGVQMSIMESHGTVVFFIGERLANTAGKVEGSYLWLYSRWRTQGLA